MVAISESLRAEAVSDNPAAAAAKSLQLCGTLCDPRDGSPPGSPVPGILQAKTLEWVAISFSNAWNWKVKVKSLSRIQLLAPPWTAAHQAPPSLGFARQEYWSGVPLPSHSDNPRFPNKKMSTPPAHNYAAYKNTGVRKLIWNDILVYYCIWFYKNLYLHSDNKHLSHLPSALPLRSSQSKEQ